MKRHSDAWSNDALCSQVDPEMFFPRSRGRWDANDALTICAQCPVREPCLAEAIEQGDDWSIRGGMTPGERHKLIRLRLAKTRRHVPVELPAYRTVE